MSALPFNRCVPQVCRNECGVTRFLIPTVLDLDTSGVSAADARIIESNIATTIMQTGAYQVIGRSEREAILQEVGYQSSDCADEKCQIEIGKLLSADLIVVGTVDKADTKLAVHLKVIEVESGLTVRSSSHSYESLAELVKDSQRLTLEVVDAGSSPAQADVYDSEVERTEMPKALDGFVFVEAGSFQMGSDDGGRAEKPVHTVTITRSLYPFRKPR